MSYWNAACITISQIHFFRLIDLKIFMSVGFFTWIWKEKTLCLRNNMKNSSPLKILCIWLILEYPNSSWKKMDNILNKRKFDISKAISYFQALTLNNSIVIILHITLLASSRRDDIISMIYIIIYLQTKTLPWINVKASSIK